MKTKLWLIGILAFLLGLTFHVRWRPSYYEMRGVLAVEQRLVGVELVVTWPGFGKLDPEWNIWRTKPMGWSDFSDRRLE